MKKLKRNESKRKEKTLEERVAFLERAHKKRVKFESVLTMYKYIKDIYAKFEVVDGEIEKLWSNIRNMVDDVEKKKN